MKQGWLRLCAKLDALTLRERVMVFAAAAAAIVFVAWFAVLGPLAARHAALRTQVVQLQDNLAGVDAEITQKLEAFQADPDAATRQRLAAVKADTARLTDSLRAMQKGLVPPERMARVLDTLLRANGRLQLASMKTLPVAPLADLAAAASPGTPAKDAKAPGAAAPAGPLYRHGVEIAVRGNYLDLVNYMTALEAMPTQLFWGKAQLDVEQYPTSRLTLTLYTLSQDPKWMKL
jgi:MSHA biogenesis protein MshJ